MSIWFALWIVLSLVLLVFLGWSLVIVFSQQSVWKNFAEKNKLRYKAGSFLQSPEMEGVIEGFRFNFFTSEHVTQDLRGTRKMTAIEVNLQSILPIECGCASAGMVEILKQFDFKSEIRPEQEGWNKTYMIAGTHKRVLELYFNQERLSILLRLMKIPNIWMIFLCKNDITLLRIDTSNPLTSKEQLEKLAKILLAAAQALELKDGEGKALKAEEARAVVHEGVNVVSDKMPVGGLTLELEEEDAPAPKTDPEN